MTIDDGSTFRTLLLLASNDKLQTMLTRHKDADMLRAIRAELARRASPDSTARAGAQRWRPRPAIPPPPPPPH